MAARQGPLTKVEKTTWLRFQPSVTCTIPASQMTFTRATLWGYKNFLANSSFLLGTAQFLFQEDSLYQEI